MQLHRQQYKMWKDGIKVVKELLLQFYIFCYFSFLLTEVYIVFLTVRMYVCNIPKKRKKNQNKKSAIFDSDVQRSMHF